MKPDRLNALTDGVVAIVLTIMVLELKFPAEPTLSAALAVLPLLGAYLLAIATAFLWPYVAVAIYIAVALMWLVPDKRFESLID